MLPMAITLGIAIGEVEATYAPRVFCDTIPLSKKESDQEVTKNGDRV